MPTDTTLTVRCPHCMAGFEFKPMIAYKDGRFVYRDCHSAAWRARVQM
jgi:hypothetical protein